jgi:outer membrane protein assembly factor BamD (BamD/ComL family)
MQRREVAKPLMAAMPAAPASASSVEEGRLGREVEAIDRARRARSRGNLAQALSELDAFEHMTRTGVLDREAQVLRIETLYDLGRVSRARELGDEYLRRFPNDAHGGHLRALLKLEEEK